MHNLCGCPLHVAQSGSAPGSEGERGGGRGLILIVGYENYWLSYELNIHIYNSISLHFNTYPTVSCTPVVHFVHLAFRQIQVVVRLRLSERI